MLNTYQITRKYRYTHRNLNESSQQFNLIIGKIYAKFPTATDIFHLETAGLSNLNKAEDRYGILFSFLQTRAFLSLKKDEQKNLIIDLQHALKVGINNLLKTLLGGSNQAKKKEKDFSEKAINYFLKDIKNEEEENSNKILYEKNHMHKRFVYYIINNIQRTSLDLISKYEKLLNSTSVDVSRKVC